MFLTIYYLDEPQQNIIPPNTTTKRPLQEEQDRENDTLKHHINTITIDHVLLLKMITVT